MVWCGGVRGHVISWLVVCNSLGGGSVYVLIGQILLCCYCVFIVVGIVDDGGGGVISLWLSWWVGQETKCGFRPTAGYATCRRSHCCSQEQAATEAE